MEDYGDWIWDESEYNFFMSLDDATKLEYVFDYFNFRIEDLTEEEFDNAFENELKAKSVDVNVIITETHLTISCDTKEIIDRTINMFMMDGMILIKQSETLDGCSRVYKFIGQTNPRSVN